VMAPIATVTALSRPGLFTCYFHIWGAITIRAKATAGWSGQIDPGADPLPIGDRAYGRTGRQIFPISAATDQITQDFICGSWLLLSGQTASGNPAL